MTTLAEAWQWYEETRKQLRLWGRLARRHWQELPWETLHKDEQFKGLGAAEVATAVKSGTDHLDDLAVVVLFSLFESEVRQQVLNEIASEVSLLQHRVLQSAMKDVQDVLREGSFFHVLQPYKDHHADLVEQVNQVRRYRNWVAHGKRDEPPTNLTPEDAYQRLQAFLKCIKPLSVRPQAE